MIPLYGAEFSFARGKGPSSLGPGSAINIAFGF